MNSANISIMKSDVAKERSHQRIDPRPRKHRQKANKSLHKRRPMQTPKHQQCKNYHEHMKRVKFALFLRVIMKHLSFTDKTLHDQAQMMVRECIKSQREKELEESLMSALTSRLFGLIGLGHWIACKHYLDSYLDFHNIMTDLS